MDPLLAAYSIALYFGVLILIAFFTARGATTESFFTANRKAPWYAVAFGMIGASLSGVTFISVPGAVGTSMFSYFQIVLGYLVGYIVIGTILMPLYYRMNLISIYTYLEKRLGYWSYKTGSAFFLLSRTLGSSIRLYLAAMVLQLVLFDAWGIPFWSTVLITILLIWVYTFKGGIKTIIWTDAFQTLFLIASVMISIYYIGHALGITSIKSMMARITSSHYSKTFFWDYKSENYFWKQFISGAFIAIAMTGLDQDLMQKNLTCKNIKEAQKNMFWFSVLLVIVNLFFLCLGALLYIYANQKGILIKGDKLYPTLALNEFGNITAIFFLLGITASSYASADSALASLTTCFCIDFLNFDKKEESVRKRQKLFVHIAFSLVLLVTILVFKEINRDDAIKAVLKVAMYTYGPLLGLFSFGLFTKRQVQDNISPIICIASPLICIFVNTYGSQWLNGYQFSFELLILNGLLTFIGLFIFSKKTKL
jgi:SSS family transporter